MSWIGPFFGLFIIGVVIMAPGRLHGDNEKNFGLDFKALFGLSLGLEIVGLVFGYSLVVKGWVQIQGPTRPLLFIAAFCLQFFSYQRLLGEQTGIRASFALRHAQVGWLLLAFALALDFPWPKIGLLNLGLQQLLLTWPFGVFLKYRSNQKKVTQAFLSLALAGCIPFSAFSAYFQTFLPLMGSQGANVADMHQKLFTSQAFLGSLIIFSLLYQTFAFGYLLFNRMKQVELGEEVPKAVIAWAWLSLVFSSFLGLNSRILAEVLARFADHF